MFRVTRIALLYVIGCSNHHVPDTQNVSTKQEVMEKNAVPNCVAEGETYDAKLMQPGPCCEGLTPANTTHAPDDAGVCRVEDLNPAKVCIACGDGACGTGENACNCAADCG